ncbi:MAG: cadherin-like domain-containing protein [Planctomycetaceae bacterium]|nr:cadherin-like domain-containing protein [Planctomycetaceae bacterium]
MLDLRSYFQEAGVEFQNLSGVVFHNDQLAVAANVELSGDETQARLVLVDYDIETHTAAVDRDLVIPSLGGETVVNAVNSSGSVVYLTGRSLSPAAPRYGEAFRATWTGAGIDNVGLGFISGTGSQVPIYCSEGHAVNAQGVVAGKSDGGRAVFVYDQVMEHAGDVDGAGVALGISNNGVKVGINNEGVVWEADNQTRRLVEDPAGDGTLLFAVSPDNSRLFGSSNVFGDGSASPQKLTWWTYEGVATLVTDQAGNPIDGRFTSGTNADVGYHVAQAPLAAPGDLLHIESTNSTVRIVDWFESISGLELPPDTADGGPRISYDYDSGQVAIVSGGYLFTAKVSNYHPSLQAVADSYTTPVDTTLVVASPGVLSNDSNNRGGTMQAVLVAGPAHGTLDLQPDGGFTYTPQSQFNREDVFLYKMSDGNHDSGVVTVTITLDTSYPWHNGLLPLDVSDDGLITPRDALLIINALNANAGGPLSGDRLRPLSPPFVDVSPDNYLTPLDALLVINHLNRSGASAGEGECGDVAEGGAATATLQPAAAWHAFNLPGSSLTIRQTVAAAAAVVQMRGGDLSLPVRTGGPARTDVRGDGVWDQDAEWTGATDLEAALAAILGEEASR